MHNTTPRFNAPAEWKLSVLSMQPVKILSQHFDDAIFEGRDKSGGTEIISSFMLQ